MTRTGGEQPKSGSSPPCHAHALRQLIGDCEKLQANADTHDARGDKAGVAEKRLRIRGERRGMSSLLVRAAGPVPESERVRASEDLPPRAEAPAEVRSGKPKA